MQYRGSMAGLGGKSFGCTVVVAHSFIGGYFEYELWVENVYSLTLSPRVCLGEGLTVGLFGKWCQRTVVAVKFTVGLSNIKVYKLVIRRVRYAYTNLPWIPWHPLEWCRWLGWLGKSENVRLWCRKLLFGVFLMQSKGDNSTARNISLDKLTSSHLACGTEGSMTGLCRKRFERTVVAFKLTVRRFI